MVNAFELEEAAFPRRTIIGVFHFWLEAKSDILLMRLDEKTFAPILQVLKKARQDFDWEVKLGVLRFWEAMLLNCADKNTPRMVEKNYLNEISSVILDAITDCDRPVRVRGFAVLQDLKIRFPGLVENAVVRYDGSFDELPEFILQTRRTTITLFCRRFLRSIFPNLPVFGRACW